eukprot:CAMPEP_0115838272 /NCGR_PEP_ID=MMETSP0287-20121206/5643_1 /TAXON_ID=412157 /ORGANISM="Chrysochromulina rotalis, Strain UIO044" /LENGTH=59 /DNA_ID=CAMNT_0003291793 /DNA_START=445 /DNA_END=621 /DNA_ORIENTATION=+
MASSSAIQSDSVPSPSMSAAAPPLIAWLGGGPRASSGISGLPRSGAQIGMASVSYAGAT